MNEELVTFVLRFRDEFGPHIAKIQGDIGSVRSTIENAGKAIAAAFSVRALTDFASAAMETADSIDKAMLRIGAASGESVQTLMHAANDAAVPFGTVEAAISRLVDQVASPTDGLSAAFARMGLGVESFRDLGPDDLFRQVGQAIGSITDRRAQMEAVTEIFGKAGKDLIPLFSSEMAAAEARAKQLGLVLSDDAREALVSAGDAMGEAQTRLSVLKSELAAVVLQFVDDLPLSVRTAIAFLGEFGSAIAPVVGALIGSGALNGAIATVTTALTGPLALALTATGTLLKATWVAATGPVGLTIAAITALGVIWLKWGDDIQRIASSVYLSVKSWIQDKLGAVFDFVGEKIEAVKGFFSDMYDAVVGNSFVPDMVDGIRTEFAKLSGVMVDPTRETTTATAGLFGDLATNVTDTLSGFLDAIDLGQLKIPGLSGNIPGLTIGKDGISFDPSTLATTIKDVGTGAVVGDLIGAGKALFGATDINPFAEFARQMGFLLDRKRPFLGVPAWIRAMPREDVVERLLEMGVVEYRDGFLRPAAGYLGHDFRVGTGGFRDFGAGTPAMLHGREAVVPFGQRESFAMAHSGDLLAELREIRQGLADLPRAMKIAVRDARAFA